MSSNHDAPVYESDGTAVGAVALSYSSTVHAVDDEGRALVDGSGRGRGGVCLLADDACVLTTGITFVLTKVVFESASMP